MKLLLGYNFLYCSTTVEIHKTFHPQVMIAKKYELSVTVQWLFSSQASTKQSTEHDLQSHNTTGN